MTKNVVLSTFVLLTGVVRSIVTVMAAVRVMFVGHFSVVVHDLALESSRVSVAPTVCVAVGKWPAN